MNISKKLFRLLSLSYKKYSNILRLINIFIPVLRELIEKLKEQICNTKSNKQFEKIVNYTLPKSEKEYPHQKQIKKMEVETIQMNQNSGQEGVEQIRVSQTEINNHNSAISSLEPEFRSKIEQICTTNFNQDDISNLTLNVKSVDILLMHQGCIGLRKLLSNENSPCMDAIINSNCIPYFIKFIQQPTHPVLQLEASQCLRSISYGNQQQTAYIIEYGGIPPLLKLLDSSYKDITEQAIVAVGNIAGDCSIYRDVILRYDGLKPLIKLISNTNDRKIISQCSWAISNLCRGRPLPNYELVKDAVEPLCKTMMTETDPGILTDCAWAISYLTDGGEVRAQRAIDTGIIPTLISLVGHDMLSIQIPCLRSLGNMCTYSDALADQVLNHNALSEIFKLVSHEKKALRRESYWFLSNVAAGTQFQVSQIVNSSQFVKRLFETILSDDEGIAREASFVISNCTNNASAQNILKLIEQKALKSLSDILKTAKDTKIIVNTLQSLKEILECGKVNFMQGNENPFSIELEALGAIEIIEKLLIHDDDDVYNESLSIMNRFFDFENRTR